MTPAPMASLPALGSNDYANNGMERIAEINSLKKSQIVSNSKSKINNSSQVYPSLLPDITSPVNNSLQKLNNSQFGSDEDGRVHAASVKNSDGKKVYKYEPPSMAELGFSNVDLPKKRKISKSRRNNTPLRLMSTPESLNAASLK